MIVQHVSTGIKSEASDLLDLLEKVNIKKPEIYPSSLPPAEMICFPIHFKMKLFK